MHRLPPSIKATGAGHSFEKKAGEKGLGGSVDTTGRSCHESPPLRIEATRSCLGVAKTRYHDEDNGSTEAKWGFAKRARASGSFKQACRRSKFAIVGGEGTTAQWILKRCSIPRHRVGA
jgi:hypothetical protein